MPKKPEENVTEPVTSASESRERWRVSAVSVVPHISDTARKLEEALNRLEDEGWLPAHIVKESSGRYLICSRDVQAEAEESGGRFGAEPIRSLPYSIAKFSNKHSTLILDDLSSLLSGDLSDQEVESRAKQVIKERYGALDFNTRLVVNSDITSFKEQHEREHVTEKGHNPNCTLLKLLRMTSALLQGYDKTSVN